jgi:hypothetical protein
VKTTEKLINKYISGEDETRARPVRLGTGAGPTNDGGGGSNYALNVLHYKEGVKTRDLAEGDDLEGCARCQRDRGTLGSLGIAFPL